MKIKFATILLIAAYQVFHVPPGYADDRDGVFNPHPKDECQRKENYIPLINFLNTKVGAADGPSIPIDSVQLVTVQSEGFGNLSCHGLLRGPGGIIGPGTATILYGDGAQYGATWITDEHRRAAADARLKERLASIRAHHFPIPLDQEGHIDSPLNRADMLIRAVKNSGFICDSVYRVASTPTSDEVDCNRLRYQYSIGQKNGQAIVVAK